MWHGKIVGGEKYMLVNVIGKGAYADVWLAYDLALDRFVAVKIISDKYRDIAYREIDALKLFSMTNGPLLPLIAHFEETYEALEDLSEEEEEIESEEEEEESEEEEEEEEGESEEEEGESESEEEEGESEEEEGESEEEEGESESEEEEDSTSKTYFSSSSCSTDSYDDEEASEYDSLKYIMAVIPLYGGTLYDLYRSQSVPEEVISLIFSQASTLIKYLHDRFGMIHGDIKPENFVFEGRNPKCSHIISRFRELGGLSTYAKADGNLQGSAYRLLEDLLIDEDYDTDDSSDDDYSFLDDDDDAEASPLMTEDELKQMTIQLIDFSHIHTIDEDLDFIPTRYYRCQKTIRKQPAGFYKDWFALACTMYEVKNREILFEPSSKAREDHVSLVDQGIDHLQPWLPQEEK